MKGIRPVNYKWLVRKIKKHLPQLYEDLCLDYYNPYENKCGVNQDYYVLVHSAIEYFIKNECLGIYHAVCQGYCSRLEYARTILEYANATDKLKLVPANNNKPVYSVLDNMMLRLEHIEQPKNWKDALKEYINLSGGC